MNKTGHRCILLVCALFLFLPTATMADDKETGVQEQRIIDTNKAAEQAHEVVAEVTAQHNRFLVTWLHLLDSADDAYASSAGVLTFAPKVPADLARVLRGQQRWRVNRSASYWCRGALSLPSASPICSSG